MHIIDVFVLILFGLWCEISSKCFSYRMGVGVLVVIFVGVFLIRSGLAEVFSDSYLFLGDPRLVFWGVSIFPGF